MRSKSACAHWRLSLFYVLLAADYMRVLHSYRKQGQKAPTRELEVAKKRLKEVLVEK
jgi:phage-related protein